MASVERLKRSCKDAFFRVAGAKQETCSSEMLGGQGDDFLREVPFLSIRSSGFQRWFCVTFAALRITWPHLFVAGVVFKRHGLEKTQNALARGGQLGTQQLCEGSLAELLRFWCCQFRRFRKSRHNFSFLTLSSSKSEEDSLNCFVFDAVNCESWGSLAEFDGFGAVNFHFFKMPWRIASVLMFCSFHFKTDGWLDGLTDREIGRDRSR